MWDDDEGYDTTDPKHSQWGPRMLERADHDRKYEKENRNEEADATKDQGGEA